MPARGTARARSVDALRGLTIALMILVNDSEDARSAPAWLKHMPLGRAGMTPADWVVPAFLFVVGMSIPLALRAAERRGESRLTQLRHIGWRTFGLLVMGVFMMNRHVHAGWSPPVWIGAMYLAFIATWSELPKADSKLRPWWFGVRALGIACLCTLAWTFRGPNGERMVAEPLFDARSSVWLRHGWWEILGTIGWAYLTASLIYLLARKRRDVLAVSALALLALRILASDPLLSQLHARGVLHTAHAWLGPIYDALAWLCSHVDFARNIGIPGMIATLGCLLGTRLLDARAPREDIRYAVACAALWMLAALVLQPLYGVSKMAGTPSWALASCALAALAWAALRFVLDMRNHTDWLRALQPAAQNPLLVYFLHPLVRAALGLVPGIAWLREWQQQRSPAAVAVLGAVFVTALVIALSGALARRGLRVKV